MTDPVDLTHLRELTGGDREMEERLFELFCASSEECIQTLEQNCTDGENMDWRKQAHALKGSAVNIGANSLGTACAEAQEAFSASSSDKTTLLQSIKAEYQKTRDFLKKVS